MSTTTAQLLDDLKGTKVLIVGDVMVDAYLWGQVDRISPESPVPVVDIRHEEQRLGGAANVALNVKAMGGTPLLCAVIGQDAAAQQFHTLMAEADMTTASLVESPDRHTTIKTRIIGRSQQMLRVDREDRHPLQDSDRQALWHNILSLLNEQSPDAILLQDYNKGVFSTDLIRHIVDAANDKGIPVAVDPKRDHFFGFSGVTLFKPNLKELREGLHLTETLETPAALQRAADQLRKEMPHQYTFITRSEKGVWLTDGQQTWSHPAHIRRVSDVSGAGDTVIAVATLLLAKAIDPSIMAAVANLAGGLVCEAVGVVPIQLEQLKEEVAGLDLTSA